jgi:hypothetical protein
MLGNPFFYFSVGCWIFIIAPAILNFYVFGDSTIAKYLYDFLVSFFFVFVGYNFFTNSEKRLKLEGFFSASPYFFKNLTKTIKFFSFLSLLAAIHFVLIRQQYEYGSGEGLSSFHQIPLYGLLYTYYIYLIYSSYYVRPKDEFLKISFLAILPRFLIATVWGRFFLVQALLPFVLLAIQSGYIKVNFKVFSILILIGLCVFIGLPMLRGDEISVSDSLSLLEFVIKGGPVHLIGEVDNVQNTFPNTNFLITGLFGNTFPFLFGNNDKIDIWGSYGLVVTLDRAFAFMEGVDFDSNAGPGSNYVAELLVIGGYFGLIFGSFFLGIVFRIGKKISNITPVIALPMIDALSKSLFVPRSNITYMFERAIPLTVIFIVLVFILNKIEGKNCNS